MNYRQFWHISDFDIFAKKLGLYHKGKEKIGSIFGLSLTIIYILVSLTIFIYYTISAIRRDELLVHDSTEYSKGAPYINLNNTNLFYFAFGVENAVNASRFVDETIYTARAIYYYGEKNSGGAFVTREYRDLKIEKCKVEKFGKEYQHLFTKGEFDDSYCVDNFDIFLTGGFIYDKYSCIRIQIYPCVNKTENNNHCKPQEEIDKVLAGGYFSVLLKDIGLNPTNYTNPILPTIQDFYTTISKDFFRDVIFNYEITQVESDSGLFYENKFREQYLRFDKIKESFYLRDDQAYYYKGKNICKVEIRLSDNIHVQRRSYKKFSSVFSTTGGYMQVLYTFFMLLSLIPNKFIFDKIIVNSLLNIDFNIPKNHIHTRNIKLNGNPHQHSLFLDQAKNERTKKTTEQNDLKTGVLNIKKNILNRHQSLKSNPKNINNNNDSIKIKNKEDFLSEKEKSFVEPSNNFSKIEILPKNVQLNIISYDKGTDSKQQQNDNLRKENSFFKGAKVKGISEIKFNLFDYYCYCRCFNKTKKIELFKKGCLLYRNEMDIIHIFKHRLDMEKSLKEKYCITEEMKIFAKEIVI